MALAECREDISKVRGRWGGAAGSCNTQLLKANRRKMTILTLFMLIKTLFLEKVESDFICTEILMDKTLFERMFMELQSFKAYSVLFVGYLLKNNINKLTMVTARRQDCSILEMFYSK